MLQPSDKVSIIDVFPIGQRKRAIGFVVLIKQNRKKSKNEEVPKFYSSRRSEKQPTFKRKTQKNPHV